MTLHEAIEQVLQTNGKPMSTSEIAEVINSQQLYVRKDNVPIHATQIAARVGNYPNLFTRDNGKIKLFLKDFEPISIQEVTKRLWSLFQILRPTLNYGDFHVVLFFLSLKRIGFNINQSFDPERTVDYINNFVMKTDSVFDTSYGEIFREYKVTIARIPNNRLVDFFHQIDQIDTDLYNKNFLQIFDVILYQIFHSQGRFSGEFIIPFELSRFMNELVSLPKNAKIYNPFAGVASFGIFTSSDNYYIGQEINHNTAIVGKLRLLATGNTLNKELLIGDSVEQWNPTNSKFDLIIAAPPFGAKMPIPIYGKYGPTKNFEGYLLDRGLEDLSQNGKLVVLVPESFLSSMGTNIDIRFSLVKDDLIESIISLPSGTLQNTGIKTSIIVINKSKENKGFVNFIDASRFVKSISPKEKKLDDIQLIESIENKTENDFTRIIGNEEIIANEVNLSVSRYFVAKFDGVTLADLGQIITGERIYEFPGTKGVLVRNRDLKNDKIDSFLDVDNIEEVELPRHINRIDESCVLFTTRDKNINPTYFDYKGKSIYLYKGIIALKVNESKIDVNYLISELNSDYVNDQIKSLTTGTVIPHVSQNDLLKIKIIVPKIEEQRAKVEGIRQAFLENKKKELAYQQELLGLKDESFREFASIKHTLRQYLNALTSNLAGTRTFVLNHQETGVTLDTIYSKNLSKTFGEHLLGLEGTIASMRRLLISVETSKQVLKELDLLQLVLEAQNRFKNPDIFQFEKPYFDTESFTLGDDSVLAPMVLMDEDDFYRVFSNIISNAMDHGFKDNSKKYSIRTSISFDEKERMCILEISNNGKAIAKDFTLKDLTTRGEKTTDSMGTGMGGADIKDILKNNNGILDLTNDESEEFAVTYIVKLPLFTINL